MAAPMQHPEGWVPSDTFAARLALVRNAMGGLSATEAASLCGELGDQNWRNWEDGKRPRDFERVCRKIADKTGVDLDWLMRGGPLELQKFSLLMRPDLRVLTGEAQVSDRGRGHLHTVPSR